ncbi:growth arrest-specific protein 1-like [Chrysoperla carnea]|uniref:growth arrest-specific protein 1-like n=1 Tax=Chrysoperla carnea TaxID=189513 RepID=UPI001D06019A|nr:growth arrest-specific protein 1-like [Chrysoperla carnea]
MYSITDIISTMVVLFIATVSNSEADGISCQQARLKCSYRTGCGGALSNYLEGCSEVLQGVINYCPEHCQYALVALTSTDEGKQLMTCDCDDDFCEDTKTRLEVCRAQVVNAIRNETVPCRVAQWICTADPQCSTALEYYNRYCKSMFHGKKCTHRCLNSISILRRQEKAAKLNTCQCDGHEHYNCHQIRKNMKNLCFPHDDQKPSPSRPSIEDVGNPETNEVQTSNPMLADSSKSVYITSNNYHIVTLFILVNLYAIIT